SGAGAYAPMAQDIDALLVQNRRILHVQPVGNNGADPNGSDIDPLADPNQISGIQINNLATGKNVITLGANNTDSIEPASAAVSSAPSGRIATSTSKGPATFSSMRGAPIVVAPGFDTGQERSGRQSDDYFLSVATVASLDPENDAAEGVENTVVQ